MKTMADEWDLFAKMVIPQCFPGSIQYEEMRKAFYAGASSLFHWFMTSMEPGSDEPTEADMDKVSAIADELTIFFSSHPHARRIQ